MNAAWRDYRALLAAGMLQREPRTVRIGLWFIVLAALVAAVASFVSDHPWAVALHLIVGIPGAILTIIWLMVFVPSAALLNTPANARLVPRMHRRLVELMIAGWVVQTATIVILLGQWRAAPLVASWLIGMTLSRGGLRIGAVLVLPGPMWGVVQRVLPPELLAFLTSTSGFVAEMLLLVVAGAWAVRAVLPNGGEGHIAQRARQTASIERFSFGRRREVAGAPVFARSIYPRLLARDCRHRRAGRLLMHVLGPAGHWSMSSGLLIGLLGLGVIAKILLASVATAEVREIVATQGWILPAVLGLMLGVGSEQFALRIGKTHAEQGLLRLAPLIGPAAGLNRMLAAGLLRNALLNWAASSAVVMAITVLLGADGDIVAMQAALCCVSGLPSVASLLRDFARDDSTAWFATLFWPLGGVIVCVPVALAGNLLLHLPLWPLAAVAAGAFAAALAGWRWRRMVGAPVAFPAGRLG
jgi:hypothetical protein